MPTPSLYLKWENLRASLGLKPSYVIGLDSATAALQSNARYLKGKPFRQTGWQAQLSAGVLRGASHLPDRWVEQLSTWAGWLDASSPNAFDRVRAETLSRWVVEQYPQRRYPAAMIGSTNGAATNLCAALGIPWLPQTLLICVRHTAHKDRPDQQLDWAKPYVQKLLLNNPELRAYQMHDPNQDRLKVGRVTYFRLKRTRLGDTYKQFLRKNLLPGATLFVLDCQSRWLMSKVSDRHLFQVGGEGELTSEDYLQPSAQISQFLRRRGSRYRQWHLPEPREEWPEAEWGFDPAIAEDIGQFAAEYGFRVKRIVFDQAQALSPMVADLYRWWYRQRQIPAQRLLVQSFVYLQPWRALRHGLIPFWTVFNDQASLRQLNAYLDRAEPYDEIYLSLFSNGLSSLGSASLEDWRSAIGRARQQGQFLGVNERTYPRDLAAFVRYATALARQNARYPMPPPLSLLQLDAFLAERGDRYAVSFKG